MSKVLAVETGVRFGGVDHNGEIILDLHMVDAEGNEIVGKAFISHELWRAFTDQFEKVLAERGDVKE